MSPSSTEGRGKAEPFPRGPAAPDREQGAPPGPRRKHLSQSPRALQKRAQCGTQRLPAFFEGELKEGKEAFPGKHPAISSVKLCLEWQQRPAHREPPVKVNETMLPSTGSAGSACFQKRVLRGRYIILHKSVNFKHILLNIL